MTAVVETIDFDAEYEAITARLEADYLARLNPPRIRIWDGNWILRGRCGQMIDWSFEEIELETGIGKLEMPVDYYLSAWIADKDNRPTKNVHVSVDKDGVRWTGRMDHFELDVTEDGLDIMRVYFKHDFEEWKHLCCIPNPFLPFEFQFPHGWFTFANAKWSIKLAALVNIMRIESSLWMLPDDPLDPAEWFDFDQSTWSMVVAPLKIEDDASPLSVFYSRAKMLDVAAKPICTDAQLTPTFRRYFDGDDPPWPGANLRHGCLVIDVVDNSGWTTGTSFGGNIYTGLEHALVNISDDGLTEGIDILPDPAFPDEFYQPGWKGSNPLVPALIYREDVHGIASSDFSYYPGTDVQYIAGGHSAPGVNEGIEAAIVMAGNLTACIPGVPPMGDVIDAFAKPLYTDVAFAFMAWKDIGKAEDFGFSHYKEGVAQGADRAYVFSALIALRAKMWETRERFSHTLNVADGAPWLVGQNGLGQLYVGTRLGVVVLGMPKGQILVDRVIRATLSGGPDKVTSWSLGIGQPEQKDPAVKALQEVQSMAGALQDLGML